MGLFGKRSRSESPTRVSASIPTVQFDRRRVTSAVEAEIRSTLATILELDAPIPASVYAAAVESVAAGRDLAVLHNSLVGLGLSKSRASEISRFINNKATAMMDREKQASLGITHATWLYSGAPCAAAEDAEHQAADGRKYVVAEGLLVGGRRIWPGYDLGCKCVAKSVVPGFSA